jgi:hypothetical protein
MATQLLDFTKDPFVALYFAAIQCLTDKTMSENDKKFSMSVWIIDSISLTHIYCNLPDKNAWPRYAEITAPYSDNEFLKRQKGCFLLDRNFASSNDYQTIEEVIINKSSKKKINYLTKEFIKRIDISSTKVESILLYLEKMHTSYLNLMPSFNNVVKHIDFYKRIKESKQRNQ